MTTTETESHSTVPAATGHRLAVIEFLAENQPIDDAPLYNKAVQEIAEKLGAGGMTLEEANNFALDALINETFKEPA